MHSAPWERSERQRTEQRLRTLLRTGWCQCIATENGYPTRPKDSAERKCGCTFTRQGRRCSSSTAGPARPQTPFGNQHISLGLCVCASWRGDLECPEAGGTEEMD